MYYLAKFCRICIQTHENLVDIEENDFDSIKFSEKLKACTEMVITRESLSTQICLSCVNKLRVSYQFRNMCKNSTNILQQYLTKLLNSSDKIPTDTLFNSNLEVTISTKLPRPRRKRVGKEERCSLLRKLLSKIAQDQFVYNVHIKELSTLCDRIPSPLHTTQVNNKEPKEHVKLKLKDETNKGGLRNLLDFTKNFDFGYDITSCNIMKHVDLTPLEKLTRFTETFFYDHFNDFRETILLAHDSVDVDSSDDENMFDEHNDIVEQVCVKQEYICEQPINIKSEITEEYDSDYDITSNFVQTFYESDHEVNIKRERSCSPTYVAENNRLAEIIPVTQVNNNNNSPLLQSYLQQPPLSSNKFLNKSNSSINNLQRQRTFWPYSIKCRTRGNPFINPQLKDQFQSRSFKCSTCNRLFKSPGYLKAHRSKSRH